MKYKNIGQIRYSNNLKCNKRVIIIMVRGSIAHDLIILRILHIMLKGNVAR